MTKPIVAVVGRSNVGKSTLVNRICHGQDAIVHESHGVTRDRSYHEADWCGHTFVIIDTGGIESQRSGDFFASSILDQACRAVEEADVVLFVVDGMVGITEEDETVARILRKSKRPVPVFLIVNKLDNPTQEDACWEFYALGVGTPHPCSAMHGHGTGDFLDEVVACFPKDSPSQTTPQGDIDVAIIGRPNVGKSLLTNCLAGTQRSIVSDISGTTRDAVDIVVNHADVTYRLIDTAGMRKRSSVHEDIEYYSVVRSLRAIDVADVCLLVIDASIGVTEQDQKLIGLAIKRGCAMGILLNKWDLLTDEEARLSLMESLSSRMAFATWIPMLRISALTGRSVNKVLDLAYVCAKARAQSIATSSLNRLLTSIRSEGHTVVRGTKRLKLNYMTQTGTHPPQFTFFCNASELVDDAFRRYLEKRLRETFDLTGTPVCLHFNHKRQQR